MAGAGRKNLDEALALALAVGNSTAAAAAQAKCSERTVYRRKEDPEFQARVRQLREELLDRTCAMLGGLGPAAVATLNQLLTGTGVSDGNKLAAACTALDFLFRSRELIVLEQRVADLEAALKGGHGP
jgi:hypothetical protein